AIALEAKYMIFVSDIPGILDEDNKLLAEVSAAQIYEMIASGVIFGGMIPKVEGALAALRDNKGSLEKVYIIDGTSHSLLQDGPGDLHSRLKGTCIHL
ncbi:MAG: acetylglutamate kinase, partial [Spirochaetota bacterium]